MEIVEKKLNDIHILRIQGRLDSRTAPELEKRVEDSMGNGTLQLILDFQELEYLSSAGLRIILKTAKDLKRANGKLILCAVEDYIKEVFEISGFDTFLIIVADVDQAVAMF
ncbi:MAG: STAS domain-containing protein [Desulfobacterales bacterium]|nr:STAS domain-containing protein [Desulfobacterales bacterium]